MKNRDYYLNHIEYLSAEELAAGIADGIVTLKELQDTHNFDSSKQKNVKGILSKRDDATYFSANTEADLRHYITVYPNGNHVAEANSRLRKLQEERETYESKKKERETLLRNIRRDINEYDPDEIINKLTREDLDALCGEIGVDPAIVRNYSQPVLKLNDIPESEADVPVGYTDVFFWGIPSSGKTCALSAIFSTIKSEYSMESPDSAKKFGATYRDSLINIFKNGYGNLPGRTADDRTQYMPFLLYRRGERNKRKISFFELSGEVFKYFYELANNSRIIDSSQKDDIEKSFQTLDLLLRSSNQKIHYFFIDYNQETKHSEDSNGLTQSNYLEAAATYFRDRNDIFKRRTDAVYVVVTKSDEIKGADAKTQAGNFLDENFGSFMDVLRNQCRGYSIDFKVKLFSIGDVYFKRICRINKSYSKDIINDLLEKVRPDGNGFLRTIFNS